MSVAQTSLDSESNQFELTRKTIWPHLPEGETLPQCWVLRHTSSTTPCFIDLSHDSLRASYTGPGKEDSDAAAVRTGDPIPTMASIYYFEVNIVSKGSDGYIGIGVCSGEVKSNRLPGWEKNSYGYHGDDGHSFQCSGTGGSYGPTFTTGDTVGCCLNFIDNTIFFTKNGSHLGVAFTQVSGTYYPCVGMRTQGEKIEANFGQKPFIFDIGSYIYDYKSEMIETVSSLPICVEMFSNTNNSESKTSSSTTASSSSTPILKPSNSARKKETTTTNKTDNDNDTDMQIDTTSLSSKAGTGNNSKHQWPSVLNNMVAAYLVHHGYSETAESFQQETDLTIYESKEHMENRLSVKKAVLDGDIDNAITLTENFYPDILPNNPDLLFRLKRQKFIELVVEGRASVDHESLSNTFIYGQALQSECDTIFFNEENKQSLEEAFSLMAYKDPSSSPLAYLLSPKQRVKLSSEINIAILESSGLPARPSLESIVKQVECCLNEFKEQDIPVGALLRIQDFV